jgi:hypothetical protein
VAGAGHSSDPCRCIHWFMGALVNVVVETNDERFKTMSCSERKDKHVRDRVETKQTMRGLHGAEWTGSLIIARRIAVQAVGS